MIKFIGVCGVDGVGKTTIAKRLAKELAFRYVKTPPPKYNAIRYFYEQDEISSFSRFCFYLGAVYESSEEIKVLIQNGEGVVADRYLLSLQIYHEVMSGKDLGEFIEISDFVNPDLNIILKAPIKVIQERIRERNKITFDHKLENDTIFLSRIAKRFNNVWPNSIHIDCYNRDISEVVKECVKAVEFFTNDTRKSNLENTFGVA